MKLSLSLPIFAVCALALCACNTLENRRSLYSPKKGDGYWTKTLQDGKWRKRGEDNVETSVVRGTPSAPAPRSAPSRNSAPPPPPPPVTEPSVPLPEAPPPAL